MEAYINERSQRDVVEKISRLVQNRVGIQIGEKQKQQVISALKKRIRELDIHDWEEYGHYFLHHIATETEIVVSLLTTHHTFFFREFPQFEYLKEQLKTLTEAVREQGRRNIEIWSAACSYGQEVYSLGMFMDFELRYHKIDMGFRALGTDVDEKAVNIAKNGVYKWSELKGVPKFYLGNHWARGTGDITDFCKAKRSLRDHCNFENMNLLKLGNGLGNRKFDIIFCRNVFIYFNNQQIKTITDVISRYLHKHGLFFVGLSETLSPDETTLVHHGRAVYGFKGGNVRSRISEPLPERPKLYPVPDPDNASAPTTEKTGVRHPTSFQDSELRVFCVDDSPTILSLLAKVFTKDRGFKIVGTAKDGKEAEEKIPGSGADIVTLDIHMPNMDGLTYLKKNFNENHPPVVIISSVSQDDAVLASAVMKAGAVDFVEKPTLQTLLDSSDEISFKVKKAWQLRDMDKSLLVSNLDQNYYKVRIIPDTDTKIRLMLLTPGDIKKASHVLSLFEAPQPPTIVLLDAHINVLQSFRDDLAKNSALKAGVYNQGTGFLSNRVYIDHLNMFGEWRQQIHSRTGVFLCFHRSEDKCADMTTGWKKLRIIREDSGEPSSPGMLDLIVPYTSFAYESDKILAEWPSE